MRTLIILFALFVALVACNPDEGTVLTSSDLDKVRCTYIRQTDGTVRHVCR